jgi:hypothetical protein
MARSAYQTFRKAEDQQKRLRRRKKDAPDFQASPAIESRRTVSRRAGYRTLILTEYLLRISHQRRFAAKPYQVHSSGRKKTDDPGAAGAQPAKEFTHAFDLLKASSYFKRADCP